MTNTKIAVKLMGACALAVLWTFGHAKFWAWLMGTGLGSLFGSIATGVVLPLLAIALWADLRRAP